MLGNYILFYFIFYDFARGYDFTIQENGLQVDQPPEIGNISTVRITIMKNDHAEGIIEFDPRYTAFEGTFSYLILNWPPLLNYKIPELDISSLNSHMYIFCILDGGVYIHTCTYIPLYVYAQVYTHMYMCALIWICALMYLYIYLKINVELPLGNLEPSFYLYVPKLNG